MAAIDQTAAPLELLVTGDAVDAGREALHTVLPHLSGETLERAAMAALCAAAPYMAPPYPDPPVPFTVSPISLANQLAGQPAWLAAAVTAWVRGEEATGRRFTTIRRGRICTSARVAVHAALDAHPALGHCWNETVDRIAAIAARGTSTTVSVEPV